MGFVSRPLPSVYREEELPPASQDVNEMESVSLRVLKVVLDIIAVIPFLIKLFKRSCASISMYLANQKNELSKIKFLENEAYLTEQEDGIKAKKVTFKTQAGETIRAMHYIHPHPKKTILICSGSGYCHEYFTPHLFHQFKENGYSVLAFNYTGFGESEGRVSEGGVYRSSEAAYTYLTETMQIDSKDILCWGYSLGSAAATHLGALHGIDIVLDRGFSKISNAAYTMAPRGLKWIAKFIFEQGLQFDNESKLQHCRGNVVVVSATNDTTFVKNLHHDRLKSRYEAYQRFKFFEVESIHNHVEENRFWFEDKSKRDEIETFFKIASDDRDSS